MKYILKKANLAVLVVIKCEYTVLSASCTIDDAPEL